MPLKNCGLPQNSSRYYRWENNFGLTSTVAYISLQAILAIGNSLNGSNFRGGARGFQLEVLLKASLIYHFLLVS
jgi:hypothetical protein